MVTTQSPLLLKERFLQNLDLYAELLGNIIHGEK